VFVTLNPVSPIKLATTGMCNAYKVIPAKKSKGQGDEVVDGWLTSDADIVRRHRLPLDFDPWRDGRAISSTEAGHSNAVQRASDVYGYLDALGFPRGLRASSGNGGHLLYGIDLPNDDETTTLVKSFLKAIAGRFGDNARIVKGVIDESMIDIDEKVFNASRIYTIYGTWKRKGSDLSTDRPDCPARPHRLAKILESPSHLEVTQIDLIQRVIDECVPVNKVTVTMDGDFNNVEDTPGAEPDPDKQAVYDDFKTACLSGQLKDDDDWYKAYKGNLRTLDVQALWKSKGLTCEPQGEGKPYKVQCPFHDRHSDDSLGGTILFHKPGKFPSYKCDRTACRDEFGKGNKQSLKNVLSWFGADLVNAHCAEHYDNNEDDKGSKKGRPSVADEIVKFVRANADLVRSDDGVAYARFPLDGHRETARTGSTGFKQWVAGQRVESGKGCPKPEAIKEALQVIDYYASREKRQPVYLRWAHLGDTIFLDLGSDNWSVVKVTKEGWTVEPESPVVFRRHNNMAALPVPIRGGSLDDLRPFFTGDDNGFLLYKGSILAACTAGPYFVTCFNGVQGSAKSYACRIAKRLIDPAGQAELISLPTVVDADICKGIHSRYAVCYDNVSAVSGAISDFLCTLSTGGGQEVRRLYSDDDMVVYDYKRPVWTNGIPDFTERGDLADRSIIIPLFVLKTRKSERSVDADFKEALPGTLGGLLDSLVDGLRRYDTTPEPGIHRMADAVRWVTACLGSDDFQTAYTVNRGESASQSLESSPIASLVTRYFNASKPIGASGSWSGSASELREALLGFAQKIDGDVPKDYPRKANYFAGQLRRDAPALQSRHGIDVAWKTVKGLRVISLEKFVEPVQPLDLDAEPGITVDADNNKINKDGPRIKDDMYTPLERDDDMKNEPKQESTPSTPIIPKSPEFNWDDEPKTEKDRLFKARFEAELKKIKAA
jgi:hypothetical protein